MRGGCQNARMLFISVELEAQNEDQNQRITCYIFSICMQNNYYYHYILLLYRQRFFAFLFLDLLYVHTRIMSTFGNKILIY